MTMIAVVSSGSNNNIITNSCSRQQRKCCPRHNIDRRRLSYHHRKRTRKTTFIFSILLQTTTTLLLLLLLAITKITIPTVVVVVNAKEIIATNEWQLLSENDTIPAGLHVRMDLSTGEKWVKIATNDDDDKDIKATLHDNSDDDDDAGSKVETAVMDASGALSIIEHQSNSNDDHDNGSTTNNNNNKEQHTTTTKNNKDYNMMHRVMSKLPPEELQKIGGLPELPSSPSTSPSSTSTSYHTLTKEQRVQFEKRMDEIWNTRQEELRKLMTQEHMNAPVNILKERIDSIKYYLDNVYESLIDLLDERQEKQRMKEENDENNDEEGGEGGVTNNIINALHDLEYQLSDVDMARDFHTLGGWPYLVSLLDDNVHNKGIITSTAADAAAAAEKDDNDNDVDNNKKEAMMILVDEIQALAAMAIGTAVSNLDEFHVWALEDVSSTLNNLLKKHDGINGIEEEVDDDDANVIHQNTGSGVVSALSLLISSFEDELTSRTLQMGHGSSTMAIPTDTNNNNWSSTTSSNDKYKSHATYKLRAIYALGSLLRGNPRAQQLFIQRYNGSDVLVRNVLGTLSSVRGPSVNKTLVKLDYKFASKVLALGQDVVMDVILHEDDYYTTNNEEGKEEEEEEVTTTTVSQLIVGAFTTEEWCDLSLRMLVPPTDIIGEVSSRGMKERALHAIRALAPGCSSKVEYDDDEEDGTTTTYIKKKSSWGIEEVKRVRSEWNREGSDDGLDTVYRRELLNLVDDVLEVLHQ